MYPGAPDMQDESSEAYIITYQVKLDTKNTKFQLIVIAYPGLQILWLQN